MARSIGQKAYAVVPRADEAADADVADVATIYIATVVLQVRPSKRPEVLSTLRQVMRGMRSAPGCIGCRSFSEAHDFNTLTLVSEWGSEEALEELLNSEELLVLRGMRMLLQKGAQVVVDEVAVRNLMVLDE